MSLWGPLSELRVKNWTKNFEVWRFLQKGKSFLTFESAFVKETWLQQDIVQISRKLYKLNGPVYTVL